MSKQVSTGINNIYKFIITILVTWLAVRLYTVWHNNYVSRMADKTTELDTQLWSAIKTGARYTIILLGVVVGLNNVGYDVGTILAGLGVGGLAFALAAQHTVGNIIGWLSILMERHIKPGQRIQLHGAGGQLIDGVVLDIEPRTTKIKTRYEGRIVSIPNSIIANQDVVNVDSKGGRQAFAVYKLAPSTNYAKVKLALKLLKEIAEKDENTLDLVVTELVQVSEISRDVMLLYWVKPKASDTKTRTAVNLEIVRLFEENDIQFTDRSQYEYQKNVYLLDSMA